MSPYAAHEFDPDSRNNSWANLVNFIPEGARVLDVGCSTGNLGAALIRYKGCTVVGVDTNEADVVVARDILSDARVLDITGPLPEDLLERFDVVVFADVLEHLPDPRAALRSITRALVPSGVVVYSIPNMGHMSTRLDLLSGIFPYTETGLLDRTHLHFYDRVEVDDMFHDAGYSILDENPVVVQYPDSWLTDRLDQLGLMPRQEFFGHMRDTEAQVFQYVGIARPGAHADDRVEHLRTRVMPNDEIIGYVLAVIDEKEKAEERARVTTAQLVAAQNEAAHFEELANFTYQHPIRALGSRIIRPIQNRIRGRDR